MLTNIYIFHIKPDNAAVGGESMQWLNREIDLVVVRI